MLPASDLPGPGLRGRGQGEAGWRGRPRSGSGGQDALRSRPVPPERTCRSTDLAGPPGDRQAVATYAVDPVLLFVFFLFTRVSLVSVSGLLPGLVQRVSSLQVRASRPRSTNTAERATPSPTHAYAHAHAHARQSCGVSERKQGPGRRATEAHGHRPGLQPHAKQSLRGVRPMASLKGNNLIFQVGLSQPQTAKPWPKP